MSEIEVSYRRLYFDHKWLMITMFLPTMGSIFKGMVYHDGFDTQNVSTN